MQRYTVKWGGEEKIIRAATAQDAWAQFAESNGVAMRLPKLHQRLIEETKEPPADTKPAKPTETKAASKSAAKIGK